MNEWAVVGVIVVLLGLLGTVTTPIIKLNSTITKLNTTMDQFQRRMDRQESDNHESHKRIWVHNETQDRQLASHEQRIGILEHDNRKTEGK